MLGAMYTALPTTQHNLSPTGPTHASLHDGPAGEGPFTESRSASGQAAFLDVLTEQPRFEASSGETANITFIMTERNNVGVTISSFSWKFKTLDDEPVMDGTGSSSCAIQMDGLETSEWTTGITLSSELFRDMMVQGRDQLRLTVTFRCLDANGNHLVVSRNIPAHLTHRVAMLVDEDLYPLIKDNLTRYERDVNIRSSVEFIYRTGDWDTPEAVRKLLKQLWRDEGINGAILWGYLPYGKWDFEHSDGSHEKVPIPVFYEDLDGDFIDVNGDGWYDKHIWGENDGCEIWVSLVMPPRTPVPSTKLDPRGHDTGGGLLGTYYNSRNMVNQRLTRVDPTIDNYWRRDHPEELTGNDFSIRWTGRIKADVSEQYTMALQHGGGARLWIDGDLVHDRWNEATWNVTEWLIEVHMTKGWHDIGIEYNNNNWGTAGAVRLLWTSDHVLASTINEWLETSHAYHNGDLEYNERALLFMDNDYGVKSRMREPILNKHLKPLYGDDIMVAGCTNTTNADDYIEALDKGHELVSVWSHSGSDYHHISYPDRPSDVNSSATIWKIRDTQAGLVTLIWGCHSGDYGDKGPGTSLLSDNLAANYAFSTPYGLAGAGTTRSYGSTYNSVYWAWQNGSSLATGWFAYLDAGYDKELRMRQWVEGGEDRWIEDVVLFGDPFIRIDHRPQDLSMEIDDRTEYTDESRVTLHISAVDADQMRFKNAGGDWSDWEAFSSTKEWELGANYGAHRVYLQVRNHWGNAEYLANDVITRVATMSDNVGIEINGGVESTNSNHLSLSLDIGDAEPTMVWMSLKDDGSDWTDWRPYMDTTTWKLSPGDGQRTVSVRFIGDDDIWQSGAEEAIILDTHRPVTSAVQSGDMGDLEWYVSPVTIVLDATDDLTGIEGTEWALDGGVWNDYTEPIQVANDGPHELLFRSRDVSGNVEVVKTIEFKLDTTSPEGLAVDGMDDDGMLNLPSLDLTLSAEDSTSDLEAMRFSRDGEDWGSWINYEEAWFITIPSEEGFHTIHWQVRDVAGNVATASAPLTVELDITSPGVDSVFPEAGSLDVPVEAIFTIDFDEGMDDTTLSGMNILVQDADGVPVIGELAYDLETGKTTFTPATNLQHFTTYSVLLRGEITDRAGNGLNGGSGYIWTFTTVGLAPEGPVGLTATTDNTSITLAWHPPVSMGSGEFQGYNVYRLMDEGLPNQEFEFWAYVIGTGFVDNDVAEGVQYHYIVRGVSSYAEGVDS
ncbi:MAG: Ig-like domain-containing protein, partial [Thermoplasmata archaeon]|nr:Ig-like domain-containing protein [Thermoplasmata archaeon]